ncbi:uncharacterized protein LOC134546172 isoform X2 [Bacillus rossius redtenbacheri]|uniref:uncharacterized protein LOC134546172 isoform X2 n=1 Tax=Bacillus rossius redtenbacheri TaxID=93214 RepID=UPI002FDE1AAC
MQLNWLSCVPGEPTRAYCKYCEKTLHAHRLSLLKHTCTLKHTRAAKNAFNNKESANTVPQTNQTVTSDDRERQEDSECQVNSQPTTLLLPSAKMEAIACRVDNPPLMDMSASARESDSDEPMDAQPSSNKNDGGGKFPAPPLEAATSQRPANKVIITEVPQPESSTESSEDDGNLSTHVLDTSKGRPVSGLMVSLYRLIDGRWTHLADSMTNPDGRCTGFAKKQAFVAGRYKLHYDVDRYYEHRKIDSLYPFIEIVFDVRSPQEHYHIPLLLSPYGYTTYKGS